MDREKAFVSMMNGDKVTHRLFSNKEYLYLDGSIIRDENGYNFIEGWNLRKDGVWSEGWEVYSESRN